MYVCIHVRVCTYLRSSRALTHNSSSRRRGGRVCVDKGVSTYIYINLCLCSLFSLLDRQAVVFDERSTAADMAERPVQSLKVGDSCNSGEHVHWLPCALSTAGNGSSSSSPAHVQAFFETRVAAANDEHGEQGSVSYFRGREMRGVGVSLPDEYSGACIVHRLCLRFVAWHSRASIVVCLSVCAQAWFCSRSCCLMGKRSGMLGRILAS